MTEPDMIADVDQDGFSISRVGPMKNAPTMPASQAFIRTRMELTIVAVNGYVGVKKSSNGAKGQFIRKLKALHLLEDSISSGVTEFDFLRGNECIRACGVTLRELC